MNNNLRKGEFGEKIASRYLSSKGYNILEKNYKIKTGEIDLIAIKNNTLVFIEVKTRTNINYGYPCEAVDKKKQKKILNTAFYYLKEKKIQNYQLRFDIIEIYLTEKKMINHIENAFCL